MMMAKSRVLALAGAAMLIGCGGEDAASTDDRSQEERGVQTTDARSLEERNVEITITTADVMSMCSEQIQSGQLDRVELTLMVDKLIEAAEGPKLDSLSRKALDDTAESLKGCDDEQAVRLARALR